MLPQLSAELPFLKGMVPERAPATPVPLHPGAALYYRERESDDDPAAARAGHRTVPWLAALISAVCALLRGSAIAPPTSGSAAPRCWPITVDTKPRIPHPRAHSRHVRRADLDPEQPRTEPPGVRSSVRSERPRRAGLRALSLPGILLGWTPSSGGTVCSPAPIGCPPGSTRMSEPTCIRSRSGAIRRKSRRCGTGRIGHRRSPPLFGVRTSIEGVRYQVVALLAYEGIPGNGSTVCSASPSTSSGPASTISTTSWGRWLGSPGAPARPLCGDR